jgi:predicted phage tail protein
MTDPRNPDWRNHPHWDHGATDPEPTAMDRMLERLAPHLRQAHLPRHPSASVALIIAGACHFLIVGGALADLVRMAAGGNGALLVAAVFLLGVMVLPGLALVLTGIWNLVLPLHRFVPRWYRRLRANR